MNVYNDRDANDWDPWDLVKPSSGLFVDVDRVHQKH